MFLKNSLDKEFPGIIREWSVIASCERRGEPTFLHNTKLEVAGRPRLEVQTEDSRESSWTEGHRWGKYSCSEGKQRRDQTLQTCKLQHTTVQFSASGIYFATLSCTTEQGSAVQILLSERPGVGGVESSVELSMITPEPECRRRQNSC